MLELTFLGTSSGIPTLTRNVSGLVVKRQNSKYWCLVDCGEGTQQQVLRVPYSLIKLKCIFITHIHGDHCYGLPGLLATATMAGRTEPLTIVGPKNIETYVRETMRLTDVRMSYELRFIDVELLGTHDVPGEFHVSPIVLSHRVPSYGYVFDSVPSPPRLDVEKLERAGLARGPEWGRLVRGEEVELESGERLNPADFLQASKLPQRVVVGGDNDRPGLLHDLIPRPDALVHEATYTKKISDKVGPDPQHSSALAVAQFAASAAIPNLVLTHFSARYHHPTQTHGDSILDIENEAAAVFGGTLYLANDFDQFILNSEGELKRHKNFRGQTGNTIKNSTDDTPSKRSP